MHADPANATNNPGTGTQPAVPAGLSAESLWGTLTSDPHAGVAIATLNGDLIYANDQAAKLFFGEKAEAAGYVGRSVREFFPPEMVNERVGVMRTMLETGKPVALRSIWRGFQLLTLIRFIDSEAREPDEDGPGDSPARFLFIVRRTPGEGTPEALAEETRYEFIESKMLELGPLDVLTPRELEVLALLGQGLSLKEIASALYRTVKTIEKHRAAIGAKLAAHDRVGLAEIARRAGLTTRDATRERL